MHISALLRLSRSPFGSFTFSAAAWALLLLWHSLKAQIKTKKGGSKNKNNNKPHVGTLPLFVCQVQRPPRPRPGLTPSRALDSMRKLKCAPELICIISIISPMPPPINQCSNIEANFCKQNVVQFSVGWQGGRLTAGGGVVAALALTATFAGVAKDVVGAHLAKLSLPRLPAPAFNPLHTLTHCAHTHWAHTFVFLSLPWLSTIGGLTNCNWVTRTRRARERELWRESNGERERASAAIRMRAKVQACVRARGGDCMPNNERYCNAGH